jgi:hypothetical protein
MDARHLTVHTRRPPEVDEQGAEVGGQYNVGHAARDEHPRQLARDHHRPRPRL